MHGVHLGNVQGCPWVGTVLAMQRGLVFNYDRRDIGVFLQSMWQEYVLLEQSQCVLAVSTTCTVARVQLCIHGL